MKKIFLYFSFICLFLCSLSIVWACYMNEGIYMLIVCPMTAILGTIFLRLSNEEKYAYLAYIFIVFIMSPAGLFIRWSSFKFW